MIENPGDFSPVQLEKLMAELQKSGYTLLLGSLASEDHTQAAPVSWAMLMKRACFTSRKIRPRWQQMLLLSFRDLAN
jgi:hypothetical protein